MSQDPIEVSLDRHIDAVRSGLESPESASESEPDADPELLDLLRLVRRLELPRLPGPTAEHRARGHADLLARLIGVAREAHLRLVEPPPRLCCVGACRPEPAN